MIREENGIGTAFERKSNIIWMENSLGHKRSSPDLSQGAEVVPGQILWFPLVGCQGGTYELWIG